MVVTTRLLLGSEGELRTVVPVTRGSWSETLEGQRIDVDVPWEVLRGHGGEQIERDTTNLLSGVIWPHTSFLAVEADTYIPVAGPLVADEYADGVWTLHAVGGDEWLRRSEIIPTAVRDLGWTFFDEGIDGPHAAGRTHLSGSWHARARTLLAQMRSWPLPPPFVDPPGDWGSPPPEVIDAIDHVTIREWLVRSHEAGGPEWTVRPLRTGDQITWRLLLGTPTLGATTPAVSWVQASHGRGGQITGLRVSRDGSQLTSDLTVTGGRTTGRALSAHAHLDWMPHTLATTLTVNTDVGSWEELERIAITKIDSLKRPQITASFDVPLVGMGQWNVGDVVSVWAPGVPHLHDERIARVVSRSGEFGSDTIRVELEPWGA